MVLQREPKSAAIWGYGVPGSEVWISYESNRIIGVVAGAQIKVSFSSLTFIFHEKIILDDETWYIELPPHPASEMIDFAIQQVQF